MKLLYALFLLIFIPVLAMAEIIPDKIYAVTTKPLNYKNVKANEKVDLYVLKTGTLSDELKLEHGEKIEVSVLKYVKPKRGKRNGYFNVKYINKNNETMKGSMRVSKPKDIKDIAKSAGVTVAGKILQVPGFSQAVAVSKGLISPNKNQSRLKSAETNLYESTPLTYIEEGEDFAVKEDGVVVIKLKSGK